MQHQTEPESALSKIRIEVPLHWILAMSVFFLFVSSWWMLSLPLPSDEFTYRELPFQLHKNIGMTLMLILLVMVAKRILKRVRTTPEPASMLRRLADIDHWLIYGLLSACCISGYLSSAYSGWTTSFWWLLNLPQWASESDDWNIVYSDIHQWSCWLLLAVVLLHIAAALYHGFNDEGELLKMFRLR